MGTQTVDDVMHGGAGGAEVLGLNLVGCLGDRGAPVAKGDTLRGRAISFSVRSNKYTRFLLPTTLELEAMGTRLLGSERTEECMRTPPRRNDQDPAQTTAGEDDNG